MKKQTFLILILCLFIVGLGAEEFRFSVFFDYFGGIEESVGYENLRTRVYMKPYFSDYSDKLGLEWVLSAKLWVQPLGEPQSIDPWDILDETYLFIPAGKFDFILGQKLITYGFSDVYGPLNALHSTNRATYSLDEKYDSRRPDPLLQIKFYPTFEDTIEFTYVPITRPDKERLDNVYLPDTNDWVIWSTDPYITENLNSFFINYNRYGEKMDWQFFYGYYTENTPDFMISDISVSGSDTLTPVYNKKHTLGVAYATRLGNSTLSQDFAFNLTKDLDGTDLGAQNSDITVNTQFLVNLPWGILSQTSLVYSYIINQAKHADDAEKTASDYLADEIMNFHNQPATSISSIAFMVAHFEKSFLREKLKTQLNVGFFFSPNVYFGPRMSYSISDFWSFEGGVDYTLGNPPDKDLRRNPSNDNFYARMIYSY
jgi:hypothetical protein